MGFSLVVASKSYSLVVVRGLIGGDFCWSGVQALKHMSFRSGSAWALEHRLSSHGARAYLLHGLWDIPGSGIEPISSALAGGFFTTEPPGKPH